MPIYFQSRGAGLDKMKIKLQRMSKMDVTKIMNKYGKMGVNALESVTPIDTSLSSNSWRYEVKKTGRFWSLSWHNQNTTPDGVPIVILLQYGHGTGTGGYVSGDDFINPAILPVFEQIRVAISREVRL
jgi:hypothetical protein